MDEGRDRRAAEAEALLDALSPAQRVQFAQIYERWRYCDRDVRAAFLANADNEDLSDFAARVAILADLMGWMDDATITRYCASRMAKSEYLPEWVRARVPVLSPGTLKKWKEAFRTGTLHEIGQGHASLRRITQRPRWWPWDRRF